MKTAPLWRALQAAYDMLNSRKQPPLSAFFEELQALADAILRTGIPPIPIWEQVQAAEVAFAVEHALLQ
jgi:hypothetical protein